MKRLVKGLIPTTIMAMAVSACGGGPDIDKAKADFENPSGSGKDKNAVIAANGKQNTTGDNSALALAGGGVPGLGLTADGRSARLGKLAPMSIWLPKMSQMAATGVQATRPGTKYEPLRTSQLADNCFVSSDFAAAQEELTAAIATGGKASASASFTANLSSCDPSLSGTMEMQMEMKVDGSKIAYAVETTFNAVCDNEEGSCVDGGMAQEAGIDFGNGMGMDFLQSLKAVSAWDLTADFTDEKGVKQSITSKGGIRIGYLSNGNGEEASLEYLNYVKDSSGAEVSYVLIIKANSMNGTASITIKCKDGELTCSFNDTTGEGMCSGNIDGQSFDAMWTSEEYDAVVESDDFKG